jgi:hypothetical protein
MASYKQNIQPSFPWKKIVDLDLTYAGYKWDKEELWCTVPQPQGHEEWVNLI